jgi:hypothetical protein
MSAWYLSFSQAYSVQLTNVGTIDGLLLSENATPIAWSKVGVGNKPTVALTMSPLTLTYCYAGGTFTDCVWNRNAQAGSGAHTVTINDIANFTFIRDTVRSSTIRGNANTFSISCTRAVNCTWTDPNIIQGSMAFITCNGITVTNTKYCDAVSGTTVVTYAMYVWNLSSNTINSTFSGLTFPVTNTHPYTSLLIGASGCSGIKLRNIGTYASPLSMGSANACDSIYTLGTNCSNFKFQRIYVTLTRTNTMTADNSCYNITEESVMGDYADAPLSAVLTMYRKNGRSTNSVTAQTSIYGTHWSDFHTSTTAGRLQIMMNEPTVSTASQVTLTNGSAFTSAGGLYMPVIGMTATFELPYYAIGHTGFQNSALIMGGGTIANYRFEYSIDKNDGNGYSAMSASAYTGALLATALSGLTGIDATKGFKLKIKVSTTTTNATAITSLYILTNSTTTTQAYQYPLDVITLNITGLKAGSDISITNVGTDVELANVDNTTTSYAFSYETPSTIDIAIYKTGYVPYFIRGYVLSSSDSSVPVAQVADRNYI